MSSTALARQTEQFEGLIAQNFKKITSVIPKHLTPERLARIVVIEGTKNPRLLQCTSESVVRSVMLAAQLGLEPGGAFGHLYLIPYGKDCTPLIGYKGLLELARRSGQIRRLDAVCVYEGETFEVKRGLFPNLEHDQDFNIDRSDQKMIAAYAVAVLTSGDPVFEVLTRDEIESRRRRSRAGSSGPWKTDYARMARKSAIRALLNGGLVPLSAEMVQALGEDADHIETEPQQVVTISSDEAFEAAVERERLAIDVDDEAPEPAAETP
ncbi:MAG: hypothetical protein GY913_21785 [Proteobacteria bacterium]|nr:hypothetical protein [Actinomycetes bacterium]MCP4919542.1 hypothetical protein [Pseudomonadota bacterium]